MKDTPGTEPAPDDVLATEAPSSDLPAAPGSGTDDDDGTERATRDRYQPL